jgi:hypothetical protein
LKPYWSGFKKYKQLEEATMISQENKMNAKKKFIHHTIGSHGYAGKEETWQEYEEKAIQSGATPMTVNWTERSKRFVLGHGAILTTEGRMEFKMCVGGGVTSRVEGGEATTHISTESSDEASSYREGGGAVQRRLELLTSCIHEGGGAVRRQLELPTSWREGGAVWLAREANLQ